MSINCPSGAQFNTMIIFENYKGYRAHQEMGCLNLYENVHVGYTSSAISFLIEDNLDEVIRQAKDWIDERVVNSK